MDLMKIKINNIKNIKNADIELPIEGGLYSWLVAMDVAKAP